MTMFDRPEPTQSIGERISTTVPTQALAMMNSPFVRQQAEKLRCAEFKPSTMKRSDESIDQALPDRVRPRRPADAERNRMLAFVEQLVAEGAIHAADKRWSEFCQVLLCLNEFVYVD